jgi:hypothetical protein
MVSPISTSSGKVVMPPPPRLEDTFKKIDGSNKGFISESELASAIVQFSPQGVSLSKADAQAVAKDAFAKLDANADDKVTSSEFTAAASNNSANGGIAGGRPSGPPPSAPPGGSAGGQGIAKGISGSSNSQSHDLADTNKDGTVSELERLAYASKTQAANTSDSSITTPK